eukprot:scaffold244_cov172-Amphora_coffeaeformis.AAC.3
MHRQRSRGSVAADTKLYETLGLEKSATAQEIKKAFRKLAIQHHPDKGGDEQVFKEISAAYEVLKDEEKRKTYDQYGLEGLKEGGGGSPEAADIFDIFFGGGRRRAPRAPRRGEDINHTLNLSLEDLYNGKTIKMAINRSVIVGAPTECESCDGHGIVLEIRRLGLGMIQQVQRHCPTCQGAGCSVTRNKERKIVEVLVEKGMRHGEKVVFQGLGDDEPRCEAGNVNFVVKEREHDTFKRKGADLLIHKTLTLNEALTGFSFALTHLDKRQIVVQSKPGEVIPALGAANKAFVKIIPNEGMPSRGNPFVRGNLYVHFSVKFPSDGELSGEALDALRKFLPGRPPELNYNEDEVEVVNLSHTDMRNFGKGGMTAQESDSDSSDGMPEGVQCQQS